MSLRAAIERAWARGLQEPETLYPDDLGVFGRAPDAATSVTTRSGLERMANALRDRLAQGREP